MGNRFRDALEQGEFVVTCEIIPGRGAREDGQEREFEEAKRMYETGRVHAMSITDNPGGNPALLADTLGKEFLDQGIVPLVHFTCKDRSRNQIIAQLYGLERQGLENILFMTGDYQATGWTGRARPVFDLDSVHVQMLASEMNAGLVVPGRKGDVVEKPTHFYNGGVVNPFKYLEGETIPQYLKMEKKIIAGAQFLITQLGYDARKMEELIRYRDERGFDTPIIGNVFLLTRGAAKLMQKGAIAGCYVSDELLATLEEEAKAEDKGKAARIERAAQMVAIYKGLGYAGVHIGGFGINADMLNTILDRAEELAPEWRECVKKVSFGKPGGYFVYEPEIGEDGQPTGLNVPVKSPKPEQARSRKVFEKWGISRFFHHWMLTLGKRGNKVLTSREDSLDRKKGVYRHHGLEHVGKSMLYGCMDCGDCGLEATLYTCPMTQCPKCQRNGPCGGTYDGWCEVFPGERYCIWYKAYHKAKKENEMERITSYITPPNHWELFNSSPWSAYTHRRDNCAGRIPVSLGLETGAPGGVTDETDLLKKVDTHLP
ncbi:MAG: methylenetetrahydrofolate reductase C-terminal domain-containing protein [Eggerthellaceae bacterium]|nr:methylenetetrahydrofolate reductase C-terminal domain-containing protein [Eggerthellaceae bacterium]